MSANKEPILAMIDWLLDHRRQRVNTTGQEGAPAGPQPSYRPPIEGSGGANAAPYEADVNRAPEH